MSEIVTPTSSILDIKIQRKVILCTDMYGIHIYDKKMKKMKTNLTRNNPLKKNLLGGLDA